MKGVKKNILMMMVLGAVGFAGAANAAVTTKAITLTWAGSIPSAPATTGDWKFVDILTGADYVPTVGKLDVNNGTAIGTKSLDMDAFKFGIKANSAPLKASSTVKAYLAFDPSFSGLNATSPTAASPTAIISANGKPLSSGAAAAVTLFTIGASPTVADVLPVNITGKGALPITSFSAGDSVSVSATVMFTAEV